MLVTARSRYCKSCRSRFSFLVSASSLAIASGCASPQLLQRYDELSVQASPPGAAVALSAFSMAVPPQTTQLALATLAERAQAALVGQLGSKTADPGALLTALATPLQRPTTSSRTINRTVFERRVVLSLENQSLEPADRLHRATTTIRLAENFLVFRNWNQIATKYTTINLGSAKFSQSASAGLEIKADPPQIKELIEVKGTASASQSLEEAVQFQQRLVDVTGALSETSARLVQQGGFGIDLTGNVIVDVALEAKAEYSARTDVFAFTGLRRDAVTVPITIERRSVLFVKASACKSVVVDVGVDALMRHVVRGGETLSEGDDVVALQSISETAKNVELLPAEVLRVSVWVLQNSGGEKLHLRMTGSQSEVLQMASFEEALALRDYLATVEDPSSIGGRRLVLPSGTDLSTAMAKTLQIAIVKLNWADGECREM